MTTASQNVLEQVNLNHSLVLVRGDGGQRIVCAHCDHTISTDNDYRSSLAFHEGPSTEAGPQIWANASDYVDTPIVFRQYYCPNCFVALISEVVPENHPDLVDEVMDAAE